MDLCSYTPQRHMSHPLKRLRTLSLEFKDPTAAITTTSLTMSYPVPSTSTSTPPSHDRPHRAKRRQLREPGAMQPAEDPRFAAYVRPSYKPYWFDDGDIVLLVGDHLFKLKRKALACSPIFNDMFEFAEPQGEDQLDGCPVVHLQDSPEDWTTVLKWIDDPKYVAHQLSRSLARRAHASRSCFLSVRPRRGFWNQRDIAFATVAGALRIAAKYDIKDLYDTAVKHIYRVWPPTLRKMGGQAFTQDRLGARVPPLLRSRLCHLAHCLWHAPLSRPHAGA